MVMVVIGVPASASLETRTVTTSPRLPAALSLAIASTAAGSIEIQVSIVPRRVPFGREANTVVIGERFGRVIHRTSGVECWFPPSKPAAAAELSTADTSISDAVGQPST